jgi:hypothetical protein
MAVISSDQITETRTILENAKSIAIVLGSNPTLDAVAASLAFYLSLSLAGKQVSVSCPSEMTVELSRLVGVDKISQALGSTQGKNLVISFPYQEGSIEKVSYNIENDTFNLVIEPREGYPSITPEMMRYSSSGGATDAIISIGVQKLTDLNSLYTQNQQLFTDKPIVNVDIHAQNSNFGKTNIIDSSQSSLSELSVNMLSQLALTIDADTATNLLAGITSGSNNFLGANSSAATFEAAAICLRNGARKIQVERPGFSAAQFGNSQQGKPSPITPFPAQQLPRMQKPASPRPFGQPAFGINQKQNQPQRIQQPMPQQVNKPQPKPAIPQNYAPPPRESTNPETPPDWLKPKIYRGSTLL